MVRWLHLSDVHERDKDGWHRKAMYEAIVAEVKNRPDKPDLVFMTGDLAFGGDAAEYKLLRERFLDRLRVALPGCPWFMVPGNHDLDRTRVAKPRSWMIDDEDRAIFQEIGKRGQRRRSDALLPRFEAYRALEKDVAAWGSDWLGSEQGSICKLLTIGSRRIAIVGLNTAWLCQDDHDWGHLTAGRAMVEEALVQAQNEKPDVTIVLGHHPLEAMTGEDEWSDGARIRLRLQQAKALYLHGHLHLAGGQATGDAMQSCLAIQAPSAFQAPDSKMWRNGLLWGELDFERKQLLVAPLRWNDNFKEYVVDSDAIDPRRAVKGREGWFSFSLPGQVDQPAAPISAPLQEGWEIIDTQSLTLKTEKRPSAKEMSDWFDGQFPRWEVALAEGVEPRHIVEDVVRRFEGGHVRAPRPNVVLLTGAGGEGKSAALLQAVAKLVQGKQDWTCLWRAAAAASIPNDFFSQLEHRPGHAWIVAVDDAENVAALLSEALRRIQPRTDVHLLLAAREADWSIRGLTDAAWHGTTFTRVTLAGLDAEDARRIAGGWVAYGDDAMARLRGRTVDQVALALLGHAQEQAAKKEEGALLGALLITREGEDLKARVTRLMEPWVTAAGFGEYSLLDVYSMIAAMHAENQLYLSRAVLAFALGCEEGVLDRGPLRVLRREAMVDSGTTYILTRHRRIAEAARDWLTEAGYDPDKWYPFLAKAANKGAEARYEPDIAQWRHDLSRHFVGRGRQRWPVAIAVAKALFETDRDDPMRLTAYASTLRRTEQVGAALSLMKQEGRRFRERRDVLYEWSVAAGESGDHGLSVWIAARSLCDDRRMPIEPKRVMLSLAGLGAAFRELTVAMGRNPFASAQAACGRLGLMLPEIDAITRSYFEKYSNVAPPPKDASRLVDMDIETLRVAVIEASYEVDPANDPSLFETLIGDPDTYQFSMLRSVIQTAISGVTRRATPRASLPSR